MGRRTTGDTDTETFHVEGSGTDVRLRGVNPGLFKARFFLLPSRIMLRSVLVELHNETQSVN